MSPENTHKLMGFYMGGLILGVNTMYRLFGFFKLFLVGCIGLIIEHSLFYAALVLFDLRAGLVVIAHFHEGLHV